jgi:hypothetical protein
VKKPRTWPVLAQNQIEVQLYPCLIFLNLREQCINLILENLHAIKQSALFTCFSHHTPFIFFSLNADSADKNSQYFKSVDSFKGFKGLSWWGWCGRRTFCRWVKCWEIVRLLPKTCRVSSPLLIIITSLCISSPLMDSDYYYYFVTVSPSNHVLRTGSSSELLFCATSINAPTFCLSFNREISVN